MSAARIVAAVLAVAFLCLAAWRLSTGRRTRAALGASLALLLSFYAGGGTLPLPEGDNAVREAGDALGDWTYPFIAVMAFLETSIPPLTVVFPGEFAVLLGGALAGEGRVDIVPVIALVWVCSALGDSVTFALGRRLGRPFLIRRGPAFGLSARRLAKVDAWLDRYGSPAVCFGRLLPLARPFGPFIAGSSSFRYRRFLAWNLVGTLLFSLLFCLVGYAFYNSYDQVADVVGFVAVGILAAVFVTVVVVILVRRRRAAAAEGAA